MSSTTPSLKPTHADPLVQESSAPVPPRVEVPSIMATYGEDGVLEAASPSIPIASEEFVENPQVAEAPSAVSAG